MDELTLKIPEQWPMTDDKLFAFCAVNEELRIERDEYGQLIIKPPTGGFAGIINFRLTGVLGQWVSKNQNLGYGFDSSTGFRLRDKSMRSPDVSWVKKEKWDNLQLEAKEKFAPVCPDFVIELRSKSDSLPQLKVKMEKWITNGCALGWLIDSVEEKAYVYTPGKPVKEITGFDNLLSGEPLLPGFQLDLSKIR